MAIWVQVEDSWNHKLRMSKLVWVWQSIIVWYSLDIPQSWTTVILCHSALNKFSKEQTIKPYIWKDVVRIIFMHFQYFSLWCLLVKKGIKNHFLSYIIWKIMEYFPLSRNLVNLKINKIKCTLMRNNFTWHSSTVFILDFVSFLGFISKKILKFWGKILS